MDYSFTYDIFCMQNAKKMYNKVLVPNSQRLVSKGNFLNIERELQVTTSTDKLFQSQLSFCFPPKNKDTTRTQSHNLTHSLKWLLVYTLFVALQSK